MFQGSCVDLEDLFEYRCKILLACKIAKLTQNFLFLNNFGLGLLCQFARICYLLTNVKNVLEYHHLPEIIKLVANTFQELVGGLCSAKKQLSLKNHTYELVQIIDLANINLEYVANLCERQGSEDLANYYTQVAFNAYVRCKVNMEELTRIIVVAVVQPATVASLLVRVSVPLPAALPVAVVRAATLA